MTAFCAAALQLGILLFFSLQLQRCGVAFLQFSGAATVAFVIAGVSVFTDLQLDCISCGFFACLGILLSTAAAALWYCCCAALMAAGSATVAAAEWRAACADCERQLTLASESL